MKRRVFLIGASSLALFSCIKPDYPRASRSAVRAAYYKSDEPPSITLLNMVNENTDSSEHIGLLINGSQRVLYDPAGSYHATGRPRRDDIHYGMKDRWVSDYESFHARLGYYVHRQKINVPLRVADLAIAKSEEKGETYQTQCASSASWVLRQLPGFGSIPQTMWPGRLSAAVGRLNGVEDSYLYEDDEGQNLRSLEVEGFDPDDTAPPPKPEFGRGEF